MVIINNEIKNFINFHKNEKYFLAVSGGPDSQCLLAAFGHIVGPERCVAVGVNHGLRTEADSELDLAEQLSRSLGIEFRRVQIKVESGPNVMSRARTARYDALLSISGQYPVVTAHTSDDQAETVMIRLLRGGRPIGMQPVKVMDSGLLIYRPLLENVTRLDIIAYLNRWNIKYATDPSNSNDRYLRVWVRNKLLPMIRERDPNISDHLNNLHDMICNNKIVDVKSLDESSDPEI